MLAAAALMVVATATARALPDTAGVLPPHASASARRAWAVRQSGLCVLAAANAERRHGLAPGTLGAIARVETGQPMPVTGDVEPWPWTLNVGGTGHWYATRAAAAAATAHYLAATRDDVDVGCMQVSMRFNRGRFASLDDALDPATNAEVAATLLSGLSRRHGPDDALGRYHSATATLATPYRAGVIRMRRVQRRTLADARASAPPGAAARIGADTANR